MAVGAEEEGEDPGERYREFGLAPQVDPPAVLAALLNEMERHTALIVHQPSDGFS